MLVLCYTIIFLAYRVQQVKHFEFKINKFLDSTVMVITEIKKKVLFDKIFKCLKPLNYPAEC